MSKKRRQFTPEFKAEVIALCRTGNRTAGQVARDLGICASVVQRWVQQSKVNPVAESGGLTGAEREELTRLRKEIVRLRMEREILKKAATFFARENV